jgi:hypothetical protein
VIVELRQYTLLPGRRDELIELFDREFVESQDACGMRILGQFRDLDRPDRFVWLREFPDMDSRLKALNDFYTGPVWKANSAKANATEHAENNYPALPVRSGENVFVFFHKPVKQWTHPDGISLARQELRLAPTLRSRLC